jgi:hypothetical protein
MQIDDPLHDEPAATMLQLITAENIMVNTGKMLADAKYWLNESKQAEIVKTIRNLTAESKVFTSTAVNELIKAICKDQQYLVDWCERLNRAATHRADYARSIISKQKAEMQNFKMY